MTKRYTGPTVDFEPEYKDVQTYFQNIGNLYTWEVDPWYETCRSWAETCYIHAGISGTEITFQGNDAEEFFSKLCMNDVKKWKVGRNKHLVMLDEEGLIAAHCLSMKDDENTYRITAALPFAAMKLLDSGEFDVAMTMRDIFVFQFSVVFWERRSLYGQRRKKSRYACACGGSCRLFSSGHRQHYDSQRH